MTIDGHYFVKEIQNMLPTRTFQRKTFEVEAVQVTDENIGSVSTWCSSPIRTEMVKGRSVKYVKVRVVRPLDERQTKAYVGDWVLYAGTGYKVYTNKAFMSCFVEVQIVTPMNQADDAVEEMFREPTAS
jgi:hypothetical protein